MIGSHLPRVLAGARRWTSCVLPTVSLTVLMLLLGFSGQALAQTPTYQSSDSATGSSSPATANKPSGTVDGDLLVVGLMLDKGSDVSITPPSGWTLIRRTDSGSNNGMATYYKVAGASEPADYDFGLSGGSSWAIGISRINGFDTSDPVDVSQGDTGGSGDVDAPSVTTTVSNTLVLAFYTNKKGATYTPDGGTSEQYDDPNTSDGLPSNMLATFAKVTAGSTGVKTAQPSESDAWTGQKVAISPSPPGFTIVESGGSTSVNESGTTDTFTVVLDVQPATNVELTVTSGDTGEATVSPSPLTFTNANWDTAQTVTVTGVDDVLVDGNQNTTITISVDDANSDDAYDPLSDQTVSATTVDDEVASFTIVESGGSTSVNESGTTDTFTVVLDAQPVTNVELTVVSGDTGEATALPTPLVFTTGNWDTAQTVTVTGVDDVLVDGNQNTTITVSVDDANSDDAYDPLADQTVSATTVDDDVAGFTIVESGGSTSVNESGTTDTFTVVLDAQPLTNVELTVVSGDTGEATALPTPLVFTTGNWDTAQTVTVTGVDDALTDGNQNTTITISVDDANSDDAFDPLSDQTVSATTVDDEVAGFTIVESGGSTSVNESGTTDTFTVVLDAQPLTNVELTVVSGDTGEATALPTPLVFTTGNWDTAQTVTVTGVDDVLVDGNQNTTITVSVDDANSDDAYDPLADQTVSATTVDDEVASFTIVEAGGSTTVNESGTTDTFTVVLDAQPLTNVELTVVSGDTGEATALPTPLVFTTGNWDTAQTVTVTGVDDALTDGNQNTTITVSVDDANSDDAYDPLADQTVSATTVDDEVASFTIVESGGSTSVNESGTTDTFTVVLDAQPVTNVELTVVSGDTGEATALPTPLVFTTGNWDTAQTVTVTGVDDALTDGNQNTTITVSVDDANSDDAFDPLSDQTVSATTVDDEVAGFTIVESGGSTSVNESGTTDTFTVVLDAQPVTNVELTVVSGDTGEATALPTPLVFTTGNWDTAQTVTVTGVDDALTDGNQNTTITISVDDANSDDAYDPLSDQTVSATTVDDEVASFTIVESGGSTSVNESGTTDTFTVVLDAQPVTNVELTVVSGDTGEATALPTPLVFTTGNWDTAQTVTVTGVDDALTDGNQNTTITISVDDANSDDAYDPLSDQTVSATTVDDEVASFTIVESGGSTSVNESGTTDTFTVVLDAQPVTNVELTVVSGDTGEATALPTPLVFTTGNWDTAQTVTVTGVDDVLVDGNQNTTITVSVDDANSDDAYDPLSDQTVSATTVDDEVAGFTIVESGGSTSVNESGTTDTFTVVLDAQPVTNVELTVVSGDTGEATALPTPLVFTTGNWDTAQTVTVTGVDDVLADGNQNTTITISVDDANSDDAFDPLSDQTVSATTVDDDVAGFTIVESGGSTSVNESGTTDTFTVVLDAQPLTNVELTVVSGDTGEATALPTPLVFTTGNWDTAQTVTVTGVDDALADGNQNTTITVSVDDANSDDAYDPLADQTVSATTVDDDVAGFTIVESGGSTSVNESGTTDTFTVVLDAQPLTNVELTVVSGDTGEATALPTPLVFTTGNWDTAQTVTVTGVDDALTDGIRTQRSRSAWMMRTPTMHSIPCQIRPYRRRRWTTKWPASRSWNRVAVRP